jgi:H+/Cl- antiporter ClcA
VVRGLLRDEGAVRVLVLAGAGAGLGALEHRPSALRCGRSGA